MDRRPARGAGVRGIARRGSARGESVPRAVARRPLSPAKDAPAPESRASPAGKRRAPFPSDGGAGTPAGTPSSHVAYAALSRVGNPGRPAGTCGRGFSAERRGFGLAGSGRRAGFAGGRRPLAGARPIEDDGKAPVFFGKARGPVSGGRFSPARWGDTPSRAFARAKKKRALRRGVDRRAGARFFVRAGRYSASDLTASSSASKLMEFVASGTTST